MNRNKQSIVEDEAAAAAAATAAGLAVDKSPHQDEFSPRPFDHWIRLFLPQAHDESDSTRRLLVSLFGDRSISVFPMAVLSAFEFVLN